MTIAPDMKFSRLANWFGSDAEVRSVIARQLSGRPMVVIPFAGGMSILPVLDAAKIVVNDAHQSLINLATVMRDPSQGPRLYRALRRHTFDPGTLAAAQERCAAREYFGGGDNPNDLYDWAVDYFVTTWMSRGGSSGTDAELSGKLPIRYSPNGGGSAQRFYNAASSVPAWRRVLRRCEITCEDAFSVLDKTHDSLKVAIYCDAPWYEEGGNYKHKFNYPDHRRLAAKLSTFNESRVVVRYGDCPTIRELYPASDWTLLESDSRSQANKAVKEILIVNKGTA